MMRLRKLGKKLVPSTILPPKKKAPVSSQDSVPEEPVPRHHWQFEAIGTQWWIGIYDVIDTAELESLKKAIAGRIERFDATYSRFRDDSMVATIAQQGGSYAIPTRGRDMLVLYRQLYDLTNGALTPLVGDFLVAAGYDAHYSLQPQKQLPTVPHWDDVMHYESGVLRVERPVTLDFGALGKGCLVDMVARILQGAGIASFCVDAGGDMVYRGPTRPLRVGLEHPDDPAAAIGVARLGGPRQTGVRNLPVYSALCGSAGNRRAWAGMHHIVDPRRRTSPQHIKAVWVAASSAMLADGLATALYFTSPQVLRKQFDFAWLIMDADGRVRRSPDFLAELFTT